MLQDEVIVLRDLVREALENATHRDVSLPPGDPSDAVYYVVTCVWCGASTETAATIRRMVDDAPIEHHDNCWYMRAKKACGWQ